MIPTKSWYFILAEIALLIIKMSVKHFAPYMEKKRYITRDLRDTPDTEVLA